MAVVVIMELVDAVIVVAGVVKDVLVLAPVDVVCWQASARPWFHKMVITKTKNKKKCINFHVHRPKHYCKR